MIVEQRSQPEISASSHLLLSAAEMRRVEEAAIAAGRSGFALMQEAGKGVAGILRRDYDARRSAIILCGPGNNGGDGFVAATELRRVGWRVVILADRERAAYRGEAGEAVALWVGEIRPLTIAALRDALAEEPRALILDALFGIGLTRDLDRRYGEIMDLAKIAGRPIIAIDIPSGIDADSGALRGFALPATRTITFGWAKPGHFLAPGEGHTGLLEILPLGFRPEWGKASGAKLWRNDPDLWREDHPYPQAEDHKYSRGLGLILARSAMFGAGLLAARAARRIGAGMIAMGAPTAIHSALIAAQPGLIVKKLESGEDVPALLAEPRYRAILVGCGSPADGEARAMALGALAGDPPVIVDGGGLSAFAEKPGDLFARLRPDCVLTPHDGEFAALFPDLAVLPDRLQATRAAAERSGACVLRKGRISLFAAPDGRAVIAPPAPADLATAGSGDVLAGILLGLMAQKMPSFSALGAALFAHGAAARHCGPRLIAEDLPEALRALPHFRLQP